MAVRFRFYAASALAVALAFISAPAQSQSLCPSYSGHSSLEGKLGNQRDIAEASAFLPVACDANRLLFSDLRFKGDNISNREGNLGLGLRSLQDSGIIGAYGYFDRKKSGVTDKYHS